MTFFSQAKLGYLTFVWTAIVNGARIYLGYHYPTDVLAGAAPLTPLNLDTKSLQLTGIAGDQLPPHFESGALDQLSHPSICESGFAR